MLHAARKVYRLVDKAAVDYEAGRSALGYMEDIAASSSYLSSVLERLLAAAPHPVSGEQPAAQDMSGLVSALEFYESTSRGNYGNVARAALAAHRAQQEGAA